MAIKALALLDEFRKGFFKAYRYGKIAARDIQLDKEIVKAAEDKIFTSTETEEVATKTIKLWKAAGLTQYADQRKVAAVMVAKLTTLMDLSDQ
jgi:hypothetical protein